MCLDEKRAKAKIMQLAFIEINHVASYCVFHRNYSHEIIPWRIEQSNVVCIKWLSSQIEYGLQNVCEMGHMLNGIGHNAAS